MLYTGFSIKLLKKPQFVKKSEHNREISLHVERRIRVDVGLVFGVKINMYLKIKYTFEIFYQPAVKL